MRFYKHTMWPQYIVIKTKRFQFSCLKGLLIISFIQRKQTHLLNLRTSNSILVFSSCKQLQSVTQYECELSCQIQTLNMVVVGLNLRSYVVLDDLDVGTVGS